MKRHWTGYIKQNVLSNVAEEKERKMTEPIKLTNDYNNGVIVLSTPENHFNVAHEIDWKTVYSFNDYHHDLKEDLRKTLLELLNSDSAKVRVDLENIATVDLSYLNAMMGFAEAHKQMFPGGFLEMTNVNKKVMTLFRLVNLTDLYSFPSHEDS